MTLEKAVSLGLDEDATIDEVPSPLDLTLDRITGATHRNMQRGTFAGLGLKAYAERTRCHEPIDTVMSDFLGDLMHLCDAVGVDFDNVQCRAEINYEAEIGGEG